MTGPAIPLLAVDGGGTKCLAVFTDEEGTVIGTGRSGSVNYQTTSAESAAKELVRAIHAARQELQSSGKDELQDGVVQAGTRQTEGEGASGAQGKPANPADPAEELQPLEVACAVFGMAGLDTEHDREMIESFVKEALVKAGITARRIVIENDGLAALLGATDGRPGILLIAGTGSIVYGINDYGRSARAGGWGYRVGDEGSGYWIGKQALIAVLRSLDGRQGPTALTDAVMPFLGLRSEEELYNWVYSAEYRVDTVARLARLVSEAEQEGDPAARSILEAGAEELFHAARAVIERLDMRAIPFTLILQGGVLQNNMFMRSRLTNQLQDFAPSCNLEEVKREPIYGVITQGLSLLP
ncbi:N-acetylglucosamine kinase [Paenibacillus lutrae]|uniref:N-acetylglucosamine kinase n=1 Tax=Paenibacillus lutrae TaxID=2078573 RepID=A0A7X3FIR5_9BACL|nr:BadF/BadG/BcrA/BcrD ATPase family protein [Paenibacillus lutrae]MVP00524.1 N-acetylglucosamine kinase [Paenibacillus lutrae]